MREIRTGLSWHRRKCTQKPPRINRLRAELVFRMAQQKCPHNANEISSLHAELVFREIPGKLVQGRG
jgi:hypothetical protein